MSTDIKAITSQENDNKESFLVKETPPNDPGFIKFYGLFWSKELVDWSNNNLLGQPKGWLGKGNLPIDFNRGDAQMNFWGQKGVYILYDRNLSPVYAGQAGLQRSNSIDNNTTKCIGNRLNEHNNGIYRNGWSLFSWFGFLSTERLNLRDKNIDKINIEWKFEAGKGSELNLLLASFEAILIEGFAPRFNARGGDLKKAVFVNQYENK